MLYVHHEVRWGLSSASRANIVRGPVELRLAAILEITASAIYGTIGTDVQRCTEIEA